LPELTQATPSSAQSDARGAMLFRVFDVLERAGVPWCVLHGYQSWPAQIGADVDLLMHPRFLPRELAKLLHDNREQIGAEVVLWLNDGAHFIVLCGRVPGEPPCILQLHVSPDYSLGGRTFYKAEEILSSRVKRDSFWVPAPHIEFGCILVNRVIKQNLRPEHERRLTELAQQNPANCEREARRFFQPADVRLILQATRTGDWARVRHYSKDLLRGLMRGPGTHASGGAAARWARRLRRWVRPPCGLHLVFLGPDGVGKSTVIESVRSELSPIFLREKYLTFAPSLLPGRFEVLKPDGPHSLPPRSYPASLIKAAWWTLCYTAGYLISVHSTLARSGLVINHRYLPDAIVDPKRYRYSGPQWILRALWRVAPKPHLLFLLDAPPEVIQARKKEVAPEETMRQRDAYRAMAEPLPFARVIDNSRPLPEVVAQIEQIILGYLAARADRQLRVGSGR
jgi:thymidylate kinase